jgi:hypothetical protein
MTALIIEKAIRKLLVVGPIYNQTNKLSRVKELMPNYDCIVFNGGLSYPYDDIQEVKNRIDQMNELLISKKVIYIAGRYDLLLLKETEDTKVSQWISNMCNVVLVNFPTRSVLITDGGIPYGTSSKGELFDNLELSFVSQYQDKPWHQSYNGGLGYVISNNPLTSRAPQYYSYSMQLGNLYSKEVAVYAQEVDEVGLKQTILL